MEARATALDKGEVIFVAALVSRLRRRASDGMAAAIKQRNAHAFPRGWRGEDTGGRLILAQNSACNTRIRVVAFPTPTMSAGGLAGA